MTKRKRLKLIKERYFVWLSKQEYEEDKHTANDVHPEREE
jgi:hypothetical protein